MKTLEKSQYNIILICLVLISNACTDLHYDDENLTYLVGSKTQTTSIIYSEEEGSPFNSEYFDIEVIELDSVALKAFIQSAEFHSYPQKKYDDEKIVICWSPTPVREDHLLFTSLLTGILAHSKSIQSYIATIDTLLNNTNNYYSIFINNMETMNRVKIFVIDTDKSIIYCGMCYQ